MRKVIKHFLLIILLLELTNQAGAQDGRTQYPPGLKDAYVGLNIGYINYPFSMIQLERGFTAESVVVPHTAVRIVLYGAPINKYLSARISYMRPVNWVEYRNVNGDRLRHTVWMNIAGLTLNAQAPLFKRFTLSGEMGLGVITRNGFEIDNVPVVKNANYGTALFGAGIHWDISRKWDLQMTMAWSGSNNKVRQPSTIFWGAGFTYYLRPLSPAKVEANQKGGVKFPRHFLSAGFTSNGLGYGVNNFVSKGAIPVFWGGDAHVQKGFSASYQRNIFHTCKVFALDWSAGIGIWKSRDNKEHFFTASLNPIFRFNAIRTKAADIFFEYSVAGPSLITKTVIDNASLGRKFTFHDFMEVGTFAGKRRNLYAGLRIAHYSNGNIFPQNDGVMVPLTLNLGYVLK